MGGRYTGRGLAEWEWDGEGEIYLCSSTWISLLGRCVKPSEAGFYQRTDRGLERNDGFILASRDDLDRALPPR